MSALLAAGATLAMPCVLTTYFKDVVLRGDAGVDEARLLIERGAFREAQATETYALAALSVAGYSVAMMELLLDSGCPADLSLAGDISPLRVAAGLGCLPIVRLLLDRGATVQQRGPARTPLACAKAHWVPAELLADVRKGTAADYSAVIALLKSRGATR